MQDRFRYLTRVATFMLGSILLLTCSNRPLSNNSEYKEVDVLQLRRQASQAYRDKDYKLAVEYYEQALLHNQDNAIIAYNLACTYALLNDAGKATAFVTQAFMSGFRDINAFQQDPDFNLVRENPGFKKTVQEIEERFKSIGTLQYVEAPSLLPYRIRFPEDYDASKAYPLLIGMHGISGNADGFVGQYDMLDNPQVIFVTPEGQYPFSINIGPQWHSRSWALQGGDESLWLKADPLVSEYILNTIEKASGDHKISGVYLLGFSQGAVYAYTIGLQHSDKINGVIGFSGYLMDLDKSNSILSKSDIIEGKSLRIFIAHGTQDGAINIETGRNLFSMFKQNGYDVKFHEFEGRHQITPEIFNRAVEWIYAGTDKTSQ